MTHCCEENLSLTLSLGLCQWYYCISVIHTPQERANHGPGGLCCTPKCEEFLSCCQKQGELSNDNVRLETYRMKKNIYVSAYCVCKCNR